MVRIATWTAPRTWVSGEIVTAANMNTHVRDNLTTMTQAWTSYTPSWTGTLGNGAWDSQYQRVGITVHYQIRIDWGTTTTHPAGSQIFGLPVAAAAQYSTFGTMGQALCSDFSASTNYVGPVIMTSGSTTTVYAVAITNWGGGSPGGIPTNLVPFTWAVNDVFFIAGTYEAATL